MSVELFPMRAVVIIECSVFWFEHELSFDRIAVLLL